MGYGLDTARAISEFEDEASVALKVIGGLFVFGFLFDIHFWHPEHFTAKIFTSTIVVVALPALLALSGSIPYWPVCIFTVTVPSFLLILKYLFFRRIPIGMYSYQTANILIFQGFVLMAVFFAWMFTIGDPWSNSTRAIYTYKSGCDADYEGLEFCRGDISMSGKACFLADSTSTPTFGKECPFSCLGVYENCSVAFIVWVNPGLASLSLIVIGALVDYMTPKDPLNHNVQTIAKGTTVFLFLLWIFASLVGAGSGISGSLIAFGLAITVGSCIVVLAEIMLESNVDADDLIEEAMDDVYENTKSFLEIIQGVMILAATPLLLAYLIISIFKQVVRKLKNCCSRTPLQHTGFLTEEAASHFYNFLHNWNHSNVLTIAFYTGVAYVILSVLFAKLTTVFLSWLIEVTSPMNVYAVTGIVTAVGMGLFMLPPVPGLPIYLTSGIVLVSIGMDKLGLVGAISYATAISLGIKLLACVIQQKMIGGLLGGSVAVKQAVAINSDAIRAMRLVLSDPGITFNKVAILVGGPDWPVSVLCGILGLDLLPILIGTLPVIIIIAPTVFTGSFTFMGSLENDDGRELYPWADTMGAVATSFAAGVMFYNTIAAAGAVTSTIESRKEEIEALDYDEEVKKADEDAEKNAVFRKRVVVWSNVPIFFKLCLILSVLCMMACCYILVIFPKQSFEAYDLMYTISEHLGGQWMNIVKPLGRKALLLFCVSILFFHFFSAWASRETKKAIESSKSSESEALKKSSENKATYS